jgi:hypothetical protein
MDCYIVVGNTGRGKSSICEEIIKKGIAEKLSPIIYDPNAEWKKYTGAKPFVYFDDFIKPLVNAKDKIMLFEEATIYLSNRGNNPYLKELVVKKRHNNNTIILNYHSLRSVPTYLLDFCNYLILFKTNDKPYFIEREFRGFDEIINSFIYLNNLSDDNKQDFHANIVLELNKPVRKTF